MASPQEARATLSGSTLQNVNLEELLNVDVSDSGLVDGVILVYDESSETWKGTQLADITLDGGDY